jgi:hypothetical protein
VSDHEDKGGGQLAPTKKPDPDEQLQLQITVRLMALTITQALSNGDVFGLMIGLLLARDAWRLMRKLKNN